MARTTGSTKEAPGKKSASSAGASEKTAGKSTKKTGKSSQKTTAAKVSTLVVREGEDSWSKSELKEVLGELHDHAERLRGELAEQQEELAGLMKDAGDGAGHDQADVGSATFERDHEITVVNNSREMLAQTERALARIEDGTYGVCESCELAIGKLRLMAFPRATLCVSCKQRQEKR